MYAYHYGYTHPSKAALAASGITPSDVANLEIWLQSDEGVDPRVSQAPLSDGDNVLTWNDQSGNSNDFTQSTEADQPLYQANEINGEAVIESDGVTEHLTLGSVPVSGNSAGTLFVVHKIEGADSQNYILSSADNASGDKYINFYTGEIGGNQKILIDMRNGGTRELLHGDTTLNDATAYLLVWRSDGSTTDLFVNNNQESITEFVGTNTGAWFHDTAGLDNMNIGCLNRSSALFHVAKGAEYVYYSGAITGDDFTGLQNYFNDKYNLW